VPLLRHKIPRIGVGGTSGGQQRRRIDTFIGILVIAAGGCAVAPPPAAARAPEPDPWCTAMSARSAEQALGIPGSLSNVSERFRESYQRARAEACKQIASGRLVIRYAFGTVEARWNGTDLGPPVVLFTPYVHALKVVSHAVFLTALLSEEPAGPARVAHVAAALESVEALRVELANPASRAARLFAFDDLPRQRRILTLTSAALASLRDGRLGQRARQDYFAAVRIPLDDNLRRASAAVLTLLHQTVAGYRRQVEAKDPRAWSSLVVVVATSHQARAREVAVQYFERLLGETVSEGASREDRLVIVEGRFEAPDQRAGLAAHDVDRASASIIFGSPDRLQSDVMADTGGLLEKLLPARRSPRRRS